MKGDFIEKEPSGLMSGYGTAWLVDELNDGYFSLVIGLPTVPSVYGDKETFEYNDLLSRVKSQVEGKEEMSAVTADFALTRENRMRLRQLTGKTYKFMVFHCGDNSYYTYYAKISWKENDAEADVSQGTLTITPSAGGEDGEDGRKFIRQTLEFDNSIPNEIKLAGTKKTEEVNISVKNPTDNLTVTATCDNSNFTATYTDGKLTVTASDSLTHDSYGFITITASSTDIMKNDADPTGANNIKRYAPWTTGIAVSYTA